MSLVDLIGIHIEAQSGAPLVLLREHDAPHRYLPVFIGDAEAAAIAFAVAGEAPPRPLTHDVMAALVESLGGRVDSVEITELRDGTFFAHVAVSGPAGGQRLDSRPSDAIALAVRFGAPVFVSDEVLDIAGTLPEENPDDDDHIVVDAEAVEEEVERFRALLEQLEPVDFDPPPSPEPDAVERGDDEAA